MLMFFHRLFLWIFLVPFALTGTGCAVFRKVTLNYSEAKLPDSQIVKDVKYWSSPNSDSVKNRLDLFLPNGRNWPIFVFVHGGEWISGTNRSR
jgi:acetyl esterase/lipase